MHSRKTFVSQSVCDASLSCGKQWCLLKGRLERDGSLTNTSCQTRQAVGYLLFSDQSALRRRTAEPTLSAAKNVTIADPPRVHRSGWASEVRVHTRLIHGSCEIHDDLSRPLIEKRVV